MTPLNHRFYDSASLARLFDETEVTRHRVIDSPRCDITIDPLHEEIALSVPAIGPEPELRQYGRISFSCRGDFPDREYEIRVDATGAHFEAYNILTSIVEEMYSGADFAKATTVVLGTYKELLQKMGRLSEEQQRGLYGELLVLRHLIEAMGESDAISSWLGPTNEQHDFGFPDFDAECKTTTSEKRIHTISSATQLERTPGRPLWLISVQITRAGSHSGESLADLVASIADSLYNEEQKFWQHMVNLGWKRSDAPLYSQKFMLRSAIQSYLVDDSFPAITSSTLANLVPNWDTVSGLTYRIDISSRRLGPSPLLLSIM